MGYDGKYGRVTTEHGDIPDDEPVIVFRGRDVILPELLGRYAALCEIHGSSAEHVHLVLDTSDRIEQWQNDHPDRVKVPDSARFFAGWQE